MHQYKISLLPQSLDILNSKGVGSKKADISKLNMPAFTR